MENLVKRLSSTLFVALLITSAVVLTPSILTPSVSAVNYSARLLITMSPLSTPDSHGDIIPQSQVFGMPGGTIKTKVYIQNTGTLQDTYNLSVTDAWGATISPITFANVQPNNLAIAVLSIPVPNGASLSSTDNVKVTVTSSGPQIDNWVLAIASNSVSDYDDTFIRSGDQSSTTQNSFKPETMYIGEFTGTPPGVENAYLKFDLRGIKYGTLMDASHPVLMAIYAYTSYPSPGGPKFNYLVYWVDNKNWVEDNVTWDNPPTVSTNDPNHYRSDNLIDNKYFENVDYPGAWLTWDVTRYAKYEYYTPGADNILSVCVVSQDPSQNNSFSTRTKEYYTLDEHPYLSIGGKLAGVSPDPVYRYGLRGGKFNFNVTIVNNNPSGLPPENYNLAITDNAGWTLHIDNTRITNVPKGESRTVNFYGIAPGAAPIGGENQEKIEIGVKSDDNAIDTSAYVLCTVSADNLYPTTDDAWVSSGYPDNNILYFGGSAGDTTFLRIQSFQDNYMNDRTFMKLDLSGLPPLGPTDYIENATLATWLWSTYADDMDVQLVAVDNDNWTEETITWNNQPALGDVIATNTLTNYGLVMDNTWVYWDITPWIANNENSDNIASFCFKAGVENTSGEYQIDGKEWKTPWQTPILRVTIGSKKRALSVSISPVHRIGDNGVTENYSVNVINMGNATDSFNLSSTDILGWTRTFDTSSFTNVKPGKSVTTTLHVAIPAGATPGTLDNVKVTATGTGGSPPTDSENCSASVNKLSSWVVAGYAPRIDNYAVGVTGAGTNIYVANNNSIGTRVNFMRYNPTAGGSWTYLSTPTNGTPFKNGTVLAWNGANYIYALGGGSYSDNASAGGNGARHNFYRYHIDNNWWEFLDNTGNTDNNSNVGAQGPGDALVVVGGFAYAIVGNKFMGSSFWKYTIATDTWSALSLPADWHSKTDDGCALVWNGGDYLYAFQGSAGPAGSPIVENFYRYSIIGNSWTKMADTPSGVDDGGSLVWISGDNIYALLGGNPSTQAIRDNCFFAYSQSGNSWTQINNLPLGIGDQNGQRMGVIGRSIYVWRGPVVNPTLDLNPVLWVYSLPTPSGASINLVVGWNLVCFTAASASDTPNSMFAPLVYGVDYVMYYWNAPGGPYSQPSPTAAVQDNRGYWVNMITTGKLVKTTGAKKTSLSETMVVGWNLPGFPVVDATTTPNKIFSPLVYGVDYVMYYWNAPGGPYSQPSPTAAVQDNRGYWVNMITTAKVVTIP